MAAVEPLSLAVMDEVRALARRLDEAKHGEKGLLKSAFRRRYGWSLSKLHRELRNVGWSSGRKRRSDAGSTRVDDQVLDELGAMLRMGVRKNGKQTMEIPTARSLLTANGREIGVGNARLARLLRDRRLDARHQAQATPHLNMRSLHPNHVHLVNPSLCLLYYAPSGKQTVLHDDEIYKNKPEWSNKLGALKCWRYVLVDHYSNTVIVRYYQAAGESTENLYDFLLYCWHHIDDRPFHGVPKMMVWDKGSANTSGPIRTALAALGVEDYAHMAGNPRAKGAVEEANNRVEKLFESRLKYQPVTSVDELNAAAERWYNAYNADAIPDYDSRLRRRGLRQPVARYALWQTIRRDQLRLLPDIDVCRYLLSAEPQSRTVRADMTVTFRHPVAGRSLSYSLRGVPGVGRRDTVMCAPMIYGDNLLRVIVTDYRGDETQHLVEPVEYDRSGQRADGVVWGDRFDAQPDTPNEHAAKRATRAAYPDAEGIQAADKQARRGDAPLGGLDAHSHLVDTYRPAYMPRPGTQMDVPDAFRVTPERLTHVQICRQITAAIGRPLTAAENKQLRDQHPDGLTADEASALARDYAAQTATMASLPVG